MDGKAVALEVEAPEPLVPRTIGLLEDRAVEVGRFRQVPILFVNDTGLRKDSGDIWTPIQKVDLPLQLRRKELVVRRQYRDVVTRGLLNAMIDCVRLVVEAVEEKLDARVLAGVAAQDIDGAIGRRVVGDDDLEVLIGLRQGALDGPANKSFVVVGGDDDADARQGVPLPCPGRSFVP